MSLSVIDVVRNMLRWFPFSFSIAGRRRGVFLAITDPLLRKLVRSPVPVAIGAINIDPRHVSERLVSYAYYNLMRNYRESPLGQFILARRPNEGEVFCDIGSNLGFYSLLAREAGYCTVTVDPEPSHFAFLERNGHLFDSIHAVAVSDKAGTFEFNIASDTNPGASSLVGNASDSIYSRTVPVEAVTFSDLISWEGIAPGRVAIIKIDVEGAEASVIQGMRPYLESGARPVIWCEVRGHQSGRNPGSYRIVSELLAAYGYAPHLPKRGSLHPVDIGSFNAPNVFDLVYLQ